MVRDDTVDVLKIVSFFVEGLELFAVSSLADVKRSGDFGRVEGVERLPDLVEDVVGDIDDVVDGAQADGFELFRKPVGTRGDFDTFYREDGVEGADV